MTSCIDEVKLPIRQTQPRLVVDGLITDEAPPYSIRLTLSGEYVAGGIFPEELIVNGAYVTLSDDRGKRVVLEQDPLQPSYYWMRDPSFRGQPGRSYTLRIEMPDGLVYVSNPESMEPVEPIERIYAEYRRPGDKPGLVDWYNVMIDTKDPADSENYYRWSAYSFIRRWTSFPPHLNPGCNTCSCLVPYFGAPTQVLSDALINGNRITRRSVLDSPVYAVGRQFVEVRQYSLTRSAYQYWIRFEEQRTRTGSLFDPQPSSIEGNVRQEKDSTVLALGYFGVSAVSKKRLVIPADTINYDQFLNRLDRAFIPPGTCESNFPLAQIGLSPAGW